MHEEDYPYPDYRSFQARREEADDVRLLHHIVLRRGFRFVLEVMLARSPRDDPEMPLRWIVIQLSQLVGVAALRAAMDKHIKRDKSRPPKPIPEIALRIRMLMRANPGMNPGEAVRRVTKLKSTHRWYQTIYDAVTNHEKDLDQILDSFQAGNLPEGIDPVLDLEEMAKKFPDFRVSDFRA